MSTGMNPDDLIFLRRETPRMAQEELISLIDEYLRSSGLSDRKASMRAGGGPDMIRDLRRRGKRVPAADVLASLERVLGAPKDSLLAAIDGLITPAAGSPPQLVRVPVKGMVQAGLWRDAIEWPQEDWYSIVAPADDRHPGAERFGLVVRGTSMDRLYPEGTIVLAVKFGDLARTPKPGERVVVLRRDRRTGDYEATLKEYDLDDKGRHILWPRSNDPEFQSPIILGGQIPIIFGDEPVPESVSAGQMDATSAPDVMITALVVGSYRPE